MLLGPKVIGILLSPPAIIILFALLGFLVQIRWFVLGSLLTGLSIAALLVLSLPLTGHELLAGLENKYRPLPALTPQDAKRQADVIVVLGGGRDIEAPEYGADTISGMTLERLRYAAYLHRRTGLPILLSGGSPFDEKISEAALMQTALEQDFRIKPRWLEQKSRTTFEQAKYTMGILGAAGIRRIYSVTHAWHMPRAMWVYEKEGFSVIAAPTAFTTLSKGERELLGYLPSAQGLAWSSLALRERMGLQWYKLKHELPAEPIRQSGSNTGTTERSFGPTSVGYGAGRY